jgi:hypothetical protein
VLVDHLRRVHSVHVVGAGVTIAGLRVPRHEATEFGVIDADGEGRVRGFLEKPADPPGLPDSPEESFASMGNYVFTTDALLEALRKDAEDEHSVHDMGGSIMPMFAETGDAWVYDFSTNIVPGATERDHGYWRDVGTIDSYFDAHMDLVSVTPVFNLYNDRWPILTLPPQQPPAKFVLGGRAEESMRRSSSSAGGPRSRWSAPARSSAAARCTARSSRPGCASSGAPASRTACSWTACTSARAPTSGGRSSTRTSWSRTGPASASTSPPTASATTSATAA